MEQPIWNFEEYASNVPGDEASVNLRAYFDRMPDDKMREYSASWSDEQVLEWDENFTNDGDLLLPCSERDVDVQEYRAVLEECIKYRDQVRGVIEDRGSRIEDRGSRIEDRG